MLLSVTRYEGPAWIQGLNMLHVIIIFVTAQSTFSKHFIAQHTCMFLLHTQGVHHYNNNNNDYYVGGADEHGGSDWYNDGGYHHKVSSVTSPTSAHDYMNIKSRRSQLQQVCSS